MSSFEEFKGGGFSFYESSPLPIFLVILIERRKIMGKGQPSSNPNGAGFPSGTGKPSGGGRGNNAPSSGGKSGGGKSGGGQSSGGKK